MKYIIFYASLLDEKYIGKITKDWLLEKKATSPQNVSNWIQHYLERYLLSASFTKYKGSLLQRLPPYTEEKFNKIKLDPPNKPVFFSKFKCYR